MSENEILEHIRNAISDFNVYRFLPIATIVENLRTAMYGTDDKRGLIRKLDRVELLVYVIAGLTLFDTLLILILLFLRVSR